MGKRILLFIVTNIAVIVTISIVFTLLGLAGYQLPTGYGGLAAFCLVWGFGGAIISLQMSRWIAKRAMGVRLVDGNTGNQTFDWLHMTVQRQARQRGLPAPEVGVYDSPEVNAFATGPSKRRSLVAVSSGLLSTLRPNEAEAVLGHEVAHIGNGDMVTMTLLQGVINAFVMFFARIVANIVRNSLDERIAFAASFAVLIVLQIALGILGSLVTAAFSRHREFHADRGGAELAGRENMIAALRRLMTTRQLVDPSHPALANFKIAGGGSWMQLLASHPPLEERIAALEAGR
jgi:heat shock protein HtpX